MRYQQFAAPAALSPWIECVWRLTGKAEAGAPPHRVFPDGCLELVVHTGQPFLERTPDGHAYRQAARLIVGQMLRAVVLEPEGRIDVWGVRVQPWGARVLFDGPASHLTGRIESALDVNARLVHAVERTIEDPRLAGARVDAIWAVLARRVGEVAPHDSLAAHVSRRILHAPGAASLERLAREAGVSGRQLERRFLASVGLTPKTFARIARFQQVFAVLDEAPETLSSVAVTCGYYDQSHLARDVRDFTGGTPAGLRRLDSALTEHFLRARRMSGFSKTSHHAVG